MLKKIKAVMLGHAVGDALGVPVEFYSRDELKENPVTNMQGFGTYPMPKGAWSDDTSMGLATLDSLSNGAINYDEIMFNFGKWYYKDEYTPTGEMFDVGNTCSFAIDNYFTHKKPWDKCGLDGERSNGNGSIMRIHPFVLFAVAKGYNNAQLSGIVKNGSSLTHAHKRAISGCIIYAHILKALLETPNKLSVYKGVDIAREQINFNMNRMFGGTMMDAMYLMEMTHYYNVFSHRIHTMKKDKIKSTGYVVDTLEAAIWCLMNTNSYKDCVLTAVNLGGDTDTIAAIAGGLAGALYGYESIPREWLDTLIKREYIEEMCERASNSWEKPI